MVRLIVKGILITTAAMFLTSCAVIREGEVGVKRRFGKYNDRPYTQGLKVFNPFTTTIVKVSTQTNNMEVELNLPSKEGLNIQAEVSILYGVMPNEAPELLRNIGPNFESTVILPVFRSAVADVTSQFMAKDMHTGARAHIEETIRKRMSDLLKDRGIVVEAVLLKSIVLPRNLARAIEEVLEAEQAAARLNFVLEQERREAERKRIEAEGVRDAQKIIAEGLSAQVLQFKSIEAFLELAKSPNTKIIISDGDVPVPVMLNPDGSTTPTVGTSRNTNATTTSTTTNSTRTVGGGN
ncbi:MAG: prohibitin family protein [Saprospiraceae bacterium]